MSYTRLSIAVHPAHSTPAPGLSVRWIGSKSLLLVALCATCFGPIRVRTLVRSARPTTSHTTPCAVAHTSTASAPAASSSRQTASSRSFVHTRRRTLGEPMCVCLYVCFVIVMGCVCDGAPSAVVRLRFVIWGTATSIGALTAAGIERLNFG